MDSGGFTATDSDTITDGIDKQLSIVTISDDHEDDFNSAKAKTKGMASTPKSSRKLTKNVSFTIPITRTGIIRKTTTKRIRTGAKPKKESASNKQSQPLSLPLTPFLSTSTTSTSTSNTTSVLSNTTTIDNVAPPQRTPFSSLHSSFNPVASSSAMLERQPNVMQNMSKQQSFNSFQSAPAINITAPVLNRPISAASLTSSNRNPSFLQFNQTKAGTELNTNGSSSNSIFYNPHVPNNFVSPFSSLQYISSQSNLQPQFVSAQSHASYTPVNNNLNFSQRQSTNILNPYASSHIYSQNQSQHVPYPGQPSFSYSASTTNSDISLSTSQISARHAISKDLPIFSGRPEEWPIFITNYNQSTERCGFTDQENLIRLQKCLKGAALESVRGKLMMPNTVCFAIETLRMLYGRPEIIHHALQRNLKNEPTVRKERLETLINFALAVQNYRTTMQAMGLSDYLNDPMLLNELIEKLPADLRLEWGKYRAMIHQRVDIVCFDMWLYNLASCASQVTTYSPYADTTKNSKKERILVHDIIDNDKSKVLPISCFKCRNNHRIYDCEEFKALNVNDRWKFIQKENLCLRCLKKHKYKNCNSKRQCGVNNCKLPHNSLLHKTNYQQQQQQIEVVNTQAVLFHARDNILFKYIPVTLYGENRSLDTYALIDEGASCSLIENDIAEQLNLEGPINELCLQWTSKITQKEETSKTVSLFVSERNNKSRFALKNVRTMSNLDLPIQTLSANQIQNNNHLNDIQIMPYYTVKAKLIIGLDNAKLIAPLEIKQNAENDLIASRCKIGWGVYGRQHDSNSSKQRIMHICSCNANDNQMDEMLKNYFSLDSVGVKRTQDTLRSKDDERALDIMEKTCKYLPKEKCWEAGLLWNRDEICLPNSLPMAKRRLSCLESKMQRDAQLKTFLNEKIRDYERKGYVRKLLPNEISYKNKSWFIPIFTVRNKNKNKTRIVWDAAAAVDNVSLNSVLLKGPDLLKSLVGVLIRFREKPIAICGDIREMFHQIRIRKDEQSFQQFLWRDGDVNKPMNTYCMNVMTFGASCSPSLANYIKNKNAERFIKQHPDAVKAICENTFVDDWLQSVDSEEQMINLATTVRKIHADGGFEMRNWISNSKVVLQSLDLSCEPANKVFVDIDDKFEKILGMWWTPVEDDLTFFQNFNMNLFDSNNKITKRNVLRVVMTIFDPLGLLGHVVIHAKILLQDIWRSKIGWDDPIQAAELETWRKWTRIIANISDVRVPRCYSLASKSENIQIHVFVDASIDAYAAVAYIRAEYKNQINCSLVASKTRVAPLKPISVPKMELMAAILGLRLCNMICKEMSLNIKQRVFWTDSKDVLYWIRSDARKFHQFVAVRVGEILEDSNVSEWRWVPSSQNVADDATKWSKPPDIQKESRWFNGPSFLNLFDESWPISEFTESKDANEVLCHLSVPSDSKFLLLPSPDPCRFGRWEKLIRCQGVILKFLRKLMQVEKVSAELEPYFVNSITESAENVLYKRCQLDVYESDINTLQSGNYLTKQSPIFKLTPYLDQFGVLRMKGRIDAIELVPFNVKRPIILPQKHNITNLIIDFYHRKYHHQHNEIVVNEIRQVFWITGLRAAVRAISKSCQYCKIRRTTPCAPIMGELPPERLAAFTRPFHFTGIDYFGPMEIAVGRRREKRWGVLFTCMTVRAIHLEIASSLSTDSFLMLLKQFISRRGVPRKIFSDNATNFRGASKVLKEEIEKISSIEVEQKYATIEWQFIPPASPHMGGTWERMVRSVKSVLMEILPNRNLKEETLRAALADVENIINSRPLTYVPLETPGSEALTPNHFLIGSLSGIREKVDPECGGLALSKNFRISNMIANEFWKRWIREYLPYLTRRTKWYCNSKQNIDLGDIVIIVDDNAKRNEWLKGVVVDVHRGKDDAVRSAVVKTKHGLSTRPVVKLAKLDVFK